MKLTDIKDPMLLRRIRLADQSQNAAQLNGGRPQEPTPGKRIRQDQGPKLNKLETAWLLYLNALYPGVTIHSQAWRVRLAGGAWFKVDHCAVVAGKWNAWECKGPKQMKNVDRGMLALKVAATQFPEVDWWLVWKEAGEWRIQRVLP